MILTCNNWITMYLKMGRFGSLRAYQVTQIPMKCEYKHRRAAESYQGREIQRISSEHFSQISVTRK